MPLLYGMNLSLAETFKMDLSGFRKSWIQLPFTQCLIIIWLVIILMFWKYRSR